jgi:hypothetical protein
MSLDESAIVDQREDSLEVAVPRKFVFTPDGAHQIAVDFSEDCQGSAQTFHRMKRLIEAHWANAPVGIRLDMRNGSAAIPTGSNRMFTLYSSAESLRIPDCIEVIRPDDFRFCPLLREVFTGLQREIDGFCDCQNLERIELSQFVEVVGRSAFRAVKDCKGAKARRPIFLTAGDEPWLRRRRRVCHMAITEKIPAKEENDLLPLKGIISYLTAKCGGNVHDLGVIQITASGPGSDAPRDIADLRDYLPLLLKGDKRVSRFALTSRFSESGQRTTRLRRPV